jgi:hypothetical protein
LQQKRALININLINMLHLIDEKTFRETKGTSYSKLSHLADGPQAYQAALREEPSSSFISVGSAVDIMLTDGKEAFREKVYVMSANKPGSEMMKTFCEVYAETGDVEFAYTQSGFKISLNQVKSKFEKEGTEFFDALIAGQGKLIIDLEEMMKVNQLVNELKTNPFTKNYFVPENDSIEILFQVPILWEVMVTSLPIDPEKEKEHIITVKSLLDIVKIDHENLTMKPMDLKTGAESFFKGYYKYKRYLQASMYTDALHYLVQNIGPEKNYDILPMGFIFADQNSFMKPIIFNSTQKDIEVGRNGYIPEGTTGYKHKGYLRLMAELHWHEKNNLWDYSYDVYQNNGEVDIDAFTVKL